LAHKGLGGKKGQVLYQAPAKRGAAVCRIGNLTWLRPTRRICALFSENYYFQNGFFQNKGD